MKGELRFIAYDQLTLDYANPRLSEFGVSRSTSQRELLDLLWDTMDVREIVYSMAASGFFSHEPLITVNEVSKNVVIEGNRRLAAVLAIKTHPIFAKRWGMIRQNFLKAS